MLGGGAPPARRAAGSAGAAPPRVAARSAAPRRSGRHKGRREGVKSQPGGGPSAVGLESKRKQNAPPLPSQSAEERSFKARSAVSHFRSVSGGGARRGAPPCSSPCRPVSALWLRGALKKKRKPTTEKQTVRRLRRAAVPRRHLAPSSTRGAGHCAAPGLSAAPAALTLASGGRISTWLFSSSFLAASFCANAELNDTFTMAATALGDGENERERDAAGCLLPRHPPTRNCYPGPPSGGGAGRGAERRGAGGAPPSQRRVGAGRCPRRGGLAHRSHGLPPGRLGPKMAGGRTTSTWFIPSS